MREEEFISKYWNYYLILESKVMSLNNYISFEKDNFKCYSNEIQLLHFSICSEVETLFKLMFTIKENNTKSNITKYINKVKKDEFYKNIVDETSALILNNNLSLKPFDFFSNNNSPEWWKDYNLIKHNRIASYKKASLENLLNSLSALFILETYYFNKNYYQKGSELSIPENTSKMFILKNLEQNFETSPTFVIADEW